MRQLLEVEKLAKDIKEFRGHLAFCSNLKLKLNLVILLILVESPAAIARRSIIISLTATAAATGAVAATLVPELVAHAPLRGRKPNTQVEVVPRFLRVL